MSACDCLEALKQKLTEHHGEQSGVCLDLKSTINMATMELRRALTPLYYSYQPKKGKRKKSHVTFNFCPFCGEKA